MPTRGMETLGRPQGRAGDEGKRKTPIPRSCRHTHRTPPGENKELGTKGWDQTAGMVTPKRWTKEGTGDTA